MIALIRRRPLTAFFVLAYLGSWVLWSPWWLSQSGVGVLPFELPFVAVAGINQLGLFAGPFASALLVTRIIEGRDGPRRLLRRMVQWRARPFWYVLALVVIPAATGLGYLFLPGTTFVLDGGVLTALAVLTNDVRYLSSRRAGSRGDRLAGLRTSSPPDTAVPGHRGARPRRHPLLLARTAVPHLRMGHGPSSAQPVSGLPPPRREHVGHHVLAVQRLERFGDARDPRAQRHQLGAIRRRHHHRSGHRKQLACRARTRSTRDHHNLHHEGTTRTPTARDRRRASPATRRVVRHAQAAERRDAAPASASRCSSCKRPNTRLARCRLRARMASVFELPSARRAAR